MYTTNESENKDTQCIFCSGKFSENEQREIWMKRFHWTLPEQRMQQKNYEKIPHFLNNRLYFHEKKS